MSVHEQAISDDGQLLAYTTDVTGRRDFTLEIKDLAYRRAPLVPASRTSGRWRGRPTMQRSSTSRKTPPGGRTRSTAGPLAGGPDVLVYEEKDELFRVYIRRSRDGQYILITSQSLTTCEMRVPAEQPPHRVAAVLLPREDHHEYDAEHRDGRFYIRTNKDAPEFRLVSFPAEDPRPESWREVIPPRDEVTLEDFRLVRGACRGVRTRGGAAGSANRRFPYRDRIIALRSRNGFATFSPTSIPILRAPATASATRRWSSPTSVFEYDMTNRTLRLQKQVKGAGGVRSRQVHRRVDPCHGPRRHAGADLTRRA